MKNIAKYFLILSAVAVSFACQKEVETFQPGGPEVEGCYGVYFPSQEASGDHIFNPTQEPKIEITVARTKTDGAITVPVKATFSEDNIFTTSDITFADGQSETTFTLAFDKAQEGKQYSAHFVIDDNKYASIYSQNSIGLDLSIMRVEMLTLKKEDGSAEAKVTFTVQNNFLEDFGIEGGPFEYEGSIQYYEVDGIRYGSVVVPAEGGIWGSGAVINFTWYPKEKYEYGEFTYQPVEVGVGYTGYDLDGSEVGADHPCRVLFCDYYHHYKDVKSNSLGTYLQFVADYGANYKLSYYDGHGGFYFNLVYDIEGTNYWYGFCDGSVVGIAEGYTRVDYRLKTETDFSYNAQTPVYIEAGYDIKTVKYAVFEGELSGIQTENKIAEMLAENSTVEMTKVELVLDEEEGMNYGTLLLSPEKSGKYTVIVLGYDSKNKNQASSSIVINHIAAEDIEANEVDINVFTEPTPERYAKAGYNEFNSFAFGIYGENLTEVHAAIIEATKLTNAFVEGLKLDEKGTYKVSEETLAKINEVGGYYNVANGLNAGTLYAVVVWATNGNLETIAYDLYETTASPEVWAHYGTATWTDVFFGPWFGADALSYDVELERSEDDPARFRLVNVYGAAFPYNDTGDWDDSKDYYFVLNTHDPDYVYAERFDTGCNWGYGNFLIVSQVSRYIANYSLDVIKANSIPAGKYDATANTVTFEPKALLKAMAEYNDGGLYVGNSENFVITFHPGENLSAPVAPKLAAKKLGNSQGFTGKDLRGERMIFERDAQPVQVKAEVVYTRKAHKAAISVASAEVE